MPSRALVVLSLALAAPALALAAPALAAPHLTSLRLVESRKDSATLHVELSEPGTPSVSYGTEPGAWTSTADAGGAGTEADIKLTGLRPNTRYFYQAEIDGEPVGDVVTFVSGRSWVTRHATILATAAVPADTPDDQALAERLFAQEADALVLLGGAGDALTIHSRSLADRVVLTSASDPAPTVPVADVLLAWSGASPADVAKAAQDAGSCWIVGIGAAAGDSSVVLQRGETSSLAITGDRLLVTLAGRDSVALAFESGTLTATLTTASATKTETMTRTCTAPKPAQAEGHEAGEEDDSMDAGPHDSECSSPPPAKK
jgi:hypothetical protein